MKRKLSSIRAQGEPVTCQQFSVSRHSGFLSGTILNMSGNCAHPLRQRHILQPPTHAWIIVGWSPNFHDPLVNSWVRSRLSLESSSGEACCLPRIPSRQSQQVDESPGERVGSILPSGGNLTPRGRARSVTCIAVGGKHIITALWKAWSEALEWCWHWTIQ